MGLPSERLTAAQMLVQSRIRMNPGWAVLLATVTTVSPSLAATSAELNVSRTPSALDCPPTEELEALVSGWRGQSLRNPNRPRRLQIAVEFHRVQDAYLARILVAGRGMGVRELRDTSSTCTPLKEAVVVSLTLLLDKEDEADGRSDANQAARPTESVVPTKVRGALGGLVATGIVGLRTAGVWASVQLAPGRWSLEAASRWLPSTRNSLGNGAVDVSMLAGSTAGCFTVVARRWVATDACAELALGRLSGQGLAYRDTSSAHALWAAVGPELRLRVALLNGTYLHLGTVASFPLRQYSFSVDGVGTAYRSSLPALIVNLGIGLGPI